MEICYVVTQGFNPFKIDVYTISTQISNMLFSYLQPCLLFDLQPMKSDIVTNFFIISQLNRSEKQLTQSRLATCLQFSLQYWQVILNEQKILPKIYCNTSPITERVYLYVCVYLCQRGPDGEPQPGCCADSHQHLYTSCPSEGQAKCSNESGAIRHPRK